MIFPKRALHPIPFFLCHIYFSFVTCVGDIVFPPSRSAHQENQSDYQVVAVALLLCARERPVF